LKLLGNKWGLLDARDFSFFILYTELKEMAIDADAAVPGINGIV